ncbi:Rft-1-domain-containing protein [Obba rivulosa]|uniref:Man(5)GlcNAc(2)-PP-dolichol translocation protein RFT1 n=1 Tax=Obba rivulosa TaxID=1052685 RepID=A0A8E2B5T0_9APHY|nr:Rft-1-domain-containing protein [Obba rivulosa]
MSQDSTLLSATLTSASFLVLLQLFSRLFTFILNQALVRLVSPQVFGTAAIQFELLLSTILFLSREGIRNALLRAPTSTKDSGKKDDGESAGAGALVTNISLLPVLLGIPTSILATLVYLRTASASTTSQPHFHLAVAIYALAAFCELLSEPLYIRAQNELRFDVRVRAEGAAVALKTVVAFAVLVALPAEWALVAFALGQAAYGLTTLVSFLRAYRGRSLFWPRKVETRVHGNTKAMYFDPALLHLSAEMTAQSVVKHFLTEGDKFLVSRLSPLADQGGYAIASNYGSLVARILFQPIEETARVFFSKTLSSASANSRDALQMASTILLALLLLFTHLLLLLVTFAPPYLSLGVSLLLPPRYLNTSAPAILQTYIYYIPAMAFNGVLEAFFASVAAPSDLRVQSRWMVAFSMGFVAAAVAAARGLGMGDSGLVWANVINLLLRASYAWRFVLRFFRERNAGEMVSWRKAAPPMPVLVAFAMSALVTRWSQAMYRDVPLRLNAQLGHVGIGMMCLIGCLATCIVFERTTFRHMYTVLRRR